MIGQDNEFDTVSSGSHQSDDSSSEREDGADAVTIWSFRTIATILVLVVLSVGAVVGVVAASGGMSGTGMGGHSMGSMEQTDDPTLAEDDAGVDGAAAPSTPAMDMDGQSMSGMDMEAESTPTAAPEDGTAGMDMSGNAGGADGGHDMSPVDMSNAAVAAPDARGNQPLTPTVVDGVKEFQLTTGITTWNILPDVQVGAYAYNGQVPGPLIRVTEGESVRIRVTNELPDSTSVHWHGLVVPNAMDGAAGVTQPPIQPGETFTYEFTVPATPGTFFYHTHVEADRQQPLGLYGAFLIDAAGAPAVAADREYVIELGEWRVDDGQTYPAMEFDGMLPNFFTINGKSYPATETINAQVGDRILLRFIGTGQFIHPMHVHGGPFQIVATDGYPVPEGAQLTKDTVLVGPGERYDVVWTALEPGTWLIHCHINHHITNDGQEVEGAGGLTMRIVVT